MKVEIDGTRASLVGRLDTASSQEVQNELSPLFAAADKALTLDCSRMEYICSSGLRIFLMLRKEAAARGGSVTVKGMSDDIRKIFMMTGLINLFNVE